MAGMSREEYTLRKWCRTEFAVNRKDDELACSLEHVMDILAGMVHP